MRLARMAFPAAAAAAALAATATLPNRRAAAETLPETGVFDGVYHRDRWGRATLGFLEFPPPLAERMAPFEGRHVRVEVKRGEQVMNPGPVRVLEMHAPTPLPEPDLAVALRLVPPSPAKGEPARLVVTLTNRSASKLRFGETSDDGIDVSWAHVSDEPPADEDRGAAVPPGAAPGSAQTRWSRWDRSKPGIGEGAWHRLDRSVARLFGSGPSELAPGASTVYAVALDAGLPAGAWEFTAATRRPPTPSRAHAELAFASLAVDVAPGPARPAATPPLRAAEVRVARVGDGVFDVLFRPQPTSDRAAPLLRDATRPLALAGRVRGFAADGAELPVRVVPEPRGQDTPAGRWSLVSFPEGGMPYRFRVEHATLLPAAPIHRLCVEVLGADGLARVEESLLVREVRYDPPARFGPETQGVRLRLRPAAPLQDRRGPLRFHLQAECSGGRPVVWWNSSGALGPGTSVEIDGAAVVLPSRAADVVFGWAAPWTCVVPVERTISLPAQPSLAPGRHVLRFTFRSRGGTYRNSFGKEVPLLDGDLMSADVPFDVR